MVLSVNQPTILSTIGDILLTPTMRDRDSGAFNHLLCHYDGYLTLPIA